jgi:type IV secretion system protein VirB10
LLALIAVVALPLLAQEAAQKPAQDSTIVVPVGTVLPVSLNTYLNTKNTQVGDTFYADTTYPIWIQQRLVIPRGSIVKGMVTEVQKPGKMSGKGRMAVRFDSILLPNGVERALVADFRGIHGPGAEKIDRKTETVEQGGTANKGQDVGTVIGTAGEGAMIGGLASGRTASGAGIGAGAGAAAGVAVVLLSRNRDLVLQPGTQFDLELRQPLNFAYGEIIFNQTELNSAERAAVTRPRTTQPRQPSGSSWLRLLRIWRW